MANKTKYGIKEALVRLLDDRTFDKISVKDLVDVCGISRNTFYYHYHDVYEVLEDIFEEETRKTIGDADSWDLWEDGILQAVEFALNNRRAVYHVYHSLNREELEHYLYRVVGSLAHEFVSQQAADLNVNEMDIKLLSVFYKHGVVGLFLEWLDNNMREDPVCLISRMGFLMRGTIRRCLEKTVNEQEIS